MLGVTGLKPDLHAGMGRSKAIQQIEQDAVTGRDRAIEADLPVQLVGRVGELVADLFPLLHRITGVALERVSRRRELDGAVVAIEQRHVELGFQLPDVARQRRRADVRTAAGPPEVQGLAEHDELPKSGDVHGLIVAEIRIPRCRYINLRNASHSVVLA